MDINQSWPPAMCHRTPAETEAILEKVHAAIRGDTRRERMFINFRTFFYDNPDVVAAFETFLFDTVAAGKKRYSADALLHRVRWWSEVETRRAANDFKLNNNYTAYLARFFMAAYPELLDVEFFKLRDRQIRVMS